MVTVALGMIDGLDRQMLPLDRELRAYARRQAGGKALMAHCGIGPLTAVTILAELGDCTLFFSSRQALRYAGLDITVHQSDQRRWPGHISRWGPPGCGLSHRSFGEVSRATARRGTKSHSAPSPVIRRLRGF
jgi:transposase